MLFYRAVTEFGVERFNIKVEFLFRKNLEQYNLQYEKSKSFEVLLLQLTHFFRKCKEVLELGYYKGAKIKHI